ncbi:MAG TPA: ribosome maturation factor RimP [Steroidobacteraceae bacterium]|nr:ribosome maturation factor RimP [Steroidobacteraceae bacterium]
MREQLLSLLEPPVGALGYELVDVEFASAGSGGLLRLYIDAPAGITVDDCERVSHRVSEILDVEDPIPGAYTLEVSSPGLDRILRTREHFERFRGSRIRVQLSLPIEGRRRYTGTLTSVTEDSIEMEVDGEPVQLERTRIQKARVVP